MKKINNLIDGLQILKNYSDEIYCQSFFICAGPEQYEKVSEEDRNELENMNWQHDEELGGWSFII